MKLKLKSRELICRYFIGCCLALSVLFYSSGTAFAIPNSYTILVQKNFIGNVTDFNYTGDVLNTNEVPIGSQVNGTYTLAYDPNFHSDYWFESCFSILGNSRSYNLFVPGVEPWRSLLFSSDNNDLYYSWNNGFPSGGLKEVYFPLQNTADGGAVSLDIHNYTSDDFIGSGNIVFYENTGFTTNLSQVTLSFKVTPVPEPSTVFLIGGGLVGLLILRRKIQ